MTRQNHNPHDFNRFSRMTSAERAAFIARVEAKLAAKADAELSAMLACARYVQAGV